MVIHLTLRGITTVVPRSTRRELIPPIISGEDGANPCHRRAKLPSTWPRCSRRPPATSVSVADTVIALPVMIPLPLSHSASPLPLTGPHPRLRPRRAGCAARHHMSWLCKYLMASLARWPCGSTRPPGFVDPQRTTWSLRLSSTCRPPRPPITLKYTPEQMLELRLTISHVVAVDESSDVAVTVALELKANGEHGFHSRRCNPRPSYRQIAISELLRWCQGRKSLTRSFAGPAPRECSRLPTT